MFPLERSRYLLFFRIITDKKKVKETGEQSAFVYWREVLERNNDQQVQPLVFQDSFHLDHLHTLAHKHESKHTHYVCSPFPFCFSVPLCTMKLRSHNHWSYCTHTVSPTCPLSGLSPKCTNMQCHCVPAHCYANKVVSVLQILRQILLLTRAREAKQKRSTHGDRGNCIPSCLLIIRSVSKDKGWINTFIALPQNKKGLTQLPHCCLTAHLWQIHTEISVPFITFGTWSNMLSQCK